MQTERLIPIAPSPPRMTLTAAARLLGVTREHLSRVLHGHRISASLTRRYADLMREQPTN